MALAAFTLVAGYALVNWLPESALQLVIGTLLLIFGLQWLRKAIYRSSGRKAMHDEEAIYAEEVAVAQRAGRDVVGAGHVRVHGQLQGGVPRGLEVVFIVLTFGLSANNVPVAVYGAAAAIVLVLIAAVLIRKPLSMVPENTLKFGVGLLLTSFGMFWSIEGLGIFRDGHHSLDFPGGDLAVLYFLASVSLLCAVLIRILRLPTRPAAIVTARETAPPERHPDDRDRGGLVIRFLKAFGRFWYDFIIGDDWKIAVGVVIALALTWLLFDGRSSGEDRHRARRRPDPRRIHHQPRDRPAAEDEAVTSSTVRIGPDLLDGVTAANDDPVGSAPDFSSFLLLTDNRTVVPRGRRRCRTQVSVRGRRALLRRERRRPHERSRSGRRSEARRRPSAGLPAFTGRSGANSAGCD